MSPTRRPDIPKLSQAIESKIVASLAETLHRQPTPNEVDAWRKRLLAYVTAGTAIAKERARAKLDDPSSI